MSTIRPREEKIGAGLILMAVAVFFFTCIDSSAKWLILSGLPALQVVFARYAGHLILALLLYVPREGFDAVRTGNPFKQFLRSIFLLCSTIFNFLALQFLPITVTTTIMFAGPVVVTLLAIPMLGERVGVRRIFAVIVGFAGVIVVMQPWGAAFHPAMFLSLGALCMGSLYFIMTRMLAGMERTSTQQVWSSAFASIVLLPFVIEGWRWPTGQMQWVIFTLIGTFGALGHICATIAHRWADASLLAPVIYIQVMLAAVAGILIFDTWPTVWTFGGGAIIIFSGLYIWQRERNLSARSSGSSLAS